MRKQRKENRMKRRALKNEVNRLHKEIYQLTHPPISIEQRLNPQRYRVVQRVCQVDDAWRIVNVGAEIEHHKNAMLHKLVQDLAKNGCIKFTMTKDVEAVELSMEITVLLPQ